MANKEEQYLELGQKLKDFMASFDALFIPACVELCREVYSTVIGEHDKDGNGFETDKIDYPDVLLAKLSSFASELKEAMHQTSFWNQQVRDAVTYEIRDRTNKGIRITTEKNIKKQEDPAKLMARMTKEDIIQMGKELGYIK